MRALDGVVIVPTSARGTTEIQNRVGSIGVQLLLEDANFHTLFQALEGCRGLGRYPPDLQT
jgi:hypothetical protein